MEVQEQPRRKRRLWIWIVGVLILFAIFFGTFCGFYTIQPIGALPEGRTVIVWRKSGEPFFNSPDALCLERVGYVSLLCRGMAMSEAPLNRIILGLPYWEWAYHQSTGGRDFDR
jgi:hypothetical protein